LDFHFCKVVPRPKSGSEFLAAQALLLLAKTSRSLTRACLRSHAITEIRRIFWVFV
jgi:hypothetical protein